jgi:hypothetical protein
MIAKFKPLFLKINILYFKMSFPNTTDGSKKLNFIPILSTANTHRKGLEKQQ